MFEMITRAGPGSVQLSGQARAAVINSGIRQIEATCTQLATVAPEMSAVQRARVRLSLCAAIRAMNEIEDLADRIERACAAWPRGVATLQVTLPVPDAREDAERAVLFAECGLDVAAP